VVDTSLGQSKCVIRSGGVKFLAVMVLRFHPKQHNMVLAGSSDGCIYSGSVTKEAPCRQILRGLQLLLCYNVSLAHKCQS